MMDEIPEKLRQLKSLDKRCARFGAAVHRYELNKPLKEVAIADIERRYGCVFPEDYKYFIIKLGNGGAGPYYGIFPITRHDDGHDLGPWDEGSLVGDLTQPFPYTDTWNLPETYWVERPDPPDDIIEETEDALWAEWDKKLERDYWHPRIMNGAIPICHEGCALRDWLVVTGEARGQVWRDLRADNEGLRCEKDESGKPLSFGQWYVRWLEEGIEKAARPK